jgi:hypothetical protein
MKVSIEVFSLKADSFFVLTHEGGVWGSGDSEMTDGPRT